jgi:beta-lactam-binding protein with PASTA domain
MASTFSITTGTNNITVSSQRSDKVLFTVTNQTGQALTGRAALATVPPDAPHAAWLRFKPPEQSERPFSINGVQDYTVEVNVPANTPAGEYIFRLDMVATHNPDETYAAGPAVMLSVAKPATEKKRFPLWIIPVIVGVLAVLGVVIYLWYRSSAMEPVPDVVNLPVDDALSTLEASGFKHKRGANEYSEMVPEYLVARTTPGAGTPAARDSQVFWFESLGSPPTLEPVPDFEPVPDVIGLTVDDAVSTLEASGFKHLYGRSEFNKVLKGRVFRTEPGAGTPAARDSQVVWFKSLGPTPTLEPVPDVVGLSVDEALSILEASGFKHKQGAVEYSGTVPKGLVARTKPDAGTPAGRDSLVWWFVSLGPTPTLESVPNVIGLKVQSALETLEASGFKHKRGANEYSGTVPIGLVARTKPDAGTPAGRDSIVWWFMSLGKQFTPTPSRFVIPGSVIITPTPP